MKSAGIINALWNTFHREIRRLVSRRIYIFTMIIVPIFSFVFFLTLLRDGLPHRLPVAVIDNDYSPTSRELTRQLTAYNTLDITSRYRDFTEARQAMQRGEIFGFLSIPDDFEADLFAERQPQIAYFTNETYFIPGALIYKSLTTMTTLASGVVVKQNLLVHGEYDRDITAQLQPIPVDMHPLGNPWVNYSIYLNNNFLPGILELLILLTTLFSIGTEIKYSTSREWLQSAHDNIFLAIAGKLFPQTIIFFAMGCLCLSLLYGYSDFPLLCGAWPMLTAMLLFVLAVQGLGVFLFCLSPSLRVSLSVASLLGVVSFSLTGFSFPAEAMYSTFRLWSDILPLRHYFLIYAEQALNGAPLFYSRIHYIALLIYALLPLPFLPLLKRALQQQVYLP